MMGHPAQENGRSTAKPTHAAVYTPEHSPDAERVAAMHREMGIDLVAP